MSNITSDEVIGWAKEFLKKAETEIRPEEVKEQHKYAVLVQNPNDKVLMTKMLDETSQNHDDEKLAKRIKLLIDQYGIPDFFNGYEKTLLKLYNSVGYKFPKVAVPAFKKYLRKSTDKIIINEREDLLKKHLSHRNEQKIGQNVNLLGEVVLGDKEAHHRYEHYLEGLKDPNINYISVKLSGIYAQINPLNYEQNKKDLCVLMGNIYQQAIDYPYVDEKGNKTFKFVNLDMEEYKDLELTFDVFTTTLSEPRFKNLRAGIVVQAYLPDALGLQERLLKFARKRVEGGGSPIKMRLVKGANLQMETITSSLRGWENPVYDAKVKVDADYLRILDKGMLPENAKVLNLGVASHNFFTIGYAFLTAKKNSVENYIEFEMLEGMANHLPRVMRHLEKHIVLYTPVVKDEHFLNAVSYLVRRMDENTSSDNFLTYSFNLKEGSKEWNFLREQFEEAMKLKDTLPSEPKRHQNRLKKAEPKKDIEHFTNQPDTDFDLMPNKEWADEIRKKWMKSPADEPYQIPIQIGDKTVEGKKKVQYYDRSQTEKICVCEVAQADKTQVGEIMDIAQKDASGWRKTTLAERNRILNKVADNLTNDRGNLIGCMSAITGKTFMEGDIEVSEATDFCRFYPYSMKTFEKLDTVSYAPKGVVLVIPPWNFPTAIPVGGVASALSGGNTVILKPATVAFPVAWEFAQCFWDAGVPKDALQVVCPQRDALNDLTTHPAVKHIIMTGGTDTAFHLLEVNPKTPLSAETGGKNAIIITANSDRDHAIMSVTKSAFSNSGQKCSACSLLLVERSVYNDPSFKEKIVDAVSSIHTGSVWDGGNVVGPMITNKNEKMLHAIDNLEDGESWLVKPEWVDKDKYMLKPSVKWNVNPGSYTFKTELFGPVLSVVPVDNLQQGIEFVNSGEYGLTSGIESLDENERAIWKDSIEAGNLYINRGITGAIVQRQPFGGMKRSAFGGGIKAGGYNYVSCFVNFTEKPVKTANLDTLPGYVKDMFDENETMRLAKASESYEKAWKEEFSVEHETQQLIGEKNIFRYRPLKDMVFRVLPNDALIDVILILKAAKITKTKLTVSMQDGDKKIEAIKHIDDKHFMLNIETDDEFVAKMIDYERVRTCSPNLPDSYYLQAAKLGKYIALTPALVEGRLELLHYLKEQSVSYEYHRYGSFSEKDVNEL